MLRCPLDTSCTFNPIPPAAGLRLRLSPDAISATCNFNPTWRDSFAPQGQTAEPLGEAEEKYALNS